MTDAEQIAALQSQVAALTEERDQLLDAFAALESPSMSSRVAAARVFAERSRACHRQLLLQHVDVKQVLRAEVTRVTEERDDMFRRYEPERLPPPIEDEPREEPSR
jgi:hypothetical protein